MSLRVLLVVPSICRSGGGVSEAARLLAHSLAKSGHIELEIATLRTEHFQTDVADWPKVPVRAFRSFGPKNYGFSPGLLLHILRSNPDLIHVHAIWMFHCLAVWLAWLGKRKPYVVTPHGMLEEWILRRSAILKKLVRFIYQDAFLESAAAIHALTEKERDDLSKAGILIQNCVVIPNFAPSPSEAKPAAWLSPQMQGRRIYLFFGRIHEKKGWKALCHAWEMACRKSPQFSSSSWLVFCGWIDGSPEFPSHVDRLFESLGNVTYAGPQYGTAKSDTMASSNVFVLPSKSEGLPMVVLEAWSFGLATMLTEECNLSVGFQLGAAVEISHDVPSIAEALLLVGRMSMNELNKMGDNARALIESRFSERVVTSQFVEIYRRAAQDIQDA